VCDSLAAEVGETTNLAVLDADRIINIAEAIGPAEITLRTWVGQSCPAHATSSGKVLLAGLDAADVRVRLASVLESFTENTVVKIADLQRELATARERGWASVAEELEVGLNAVAAPVHDGNAQVIAALSVSGPSYRMDPAQFDEAAKQTIAAADAISRRLGWVERG
jgi:DNA-binding IclR family transcriptional regulator